MSKAGKASIDVQGTAVTILSQSGNDYIYFPDRHCQTQRTGASRPYFQNWMRNRNTIEFLGVWERLNNAAFNPLEFEGVENRAGLNSFALAPRQWIDTTTEHADDTGPVSSEQIALRPDPDCATLLSPVLKWGTTS